VDVEHFGKLVGQHFVDGGTKLGAIVMYLL